MAFCLVAVGTLDGVVRYRLPRERERVPPQSNKSFGVASPTNFVALTYLLLSKYIAQQHC